jgi:hypothetical protein
MPSITISKIIIPRIFVKNKMKIINQMKESPFKSRKMFFPFLFLSVIILIFLRLSIIIITIII